MADLRTLGAGEVINSWELSTRQYGAVADEAVLGVGMNCSFSSTQCLYAAFWGPQRRGDGRFRHTAAGATVEQIRIYGQIISRDGIQLQAGPFQVLDFSPADGHPDYYSMWWGSFGGAPHDRPAFHWLCSDMVVSACMYVYAVYIYMLTDWHDTIPALPGVFTIRYRVDGPAGEYAVRSTYLGESLM
jgi:hypothetical protein